MKQIPTKAFSIQVSIEDSGSRASVSADRGTINIRAGKWGGYEIDGMFCAYSIHEAVEKAIISMFRGVMSDS